MLKPHDEICQNINKLHNEKQDIQNKVLASDFLTRMNSLLYKIENSNKSVNSEIQK